MRIAIGLSVLLLGLATTAAHANTDHMGHVLEAGFAVADSVPTLGFAIADAAADHGTGYGATEVAYNAMFGTVYVQIALHHGDNDELVGGLIGGAVHNALVWHGLATIADQRDWPMSTTLVAAGSVLSSELFFMGLQRTSGLRLGAFAFNLPLAAGYAYRAYVDGRTGHPGQEALAITGSALAAGVALDGLQSHRHLGAVARAGLRPTVVDDGHDVALGVGIGRRI